MRVWMAAVLAGAVLFSAGCSPIVRENAETAGAPHETKNLAYHDGKPVTIETLDSKGDIARETFQKPPERVVAIWQNSIETLLALGVGDRIVAAMGLPDGKYLRPEYRDAYDRIPYTSMENLDMESIRMQDPDLIVGWWSSFGAKTLRSTDFWNERGVRTYISPGSSPKIKVHTVDYEFQDILNLGRVFDREAQAEALVDQMQTEISQAEAKAASLGRHPRGLIIEYLGKDINVYGAKTLAGDILTKMGGELLEADSQQISKEQIIDLDPDAIFVVVIESNYGNENEILDRIYEDKALQNLKCVKEKKIYPLPLYAIYSAGVRTYDGIQIIGKGLYGE